jgi:hypothetical protein
MAAKIILLKDLKPEDKIILPASADEAVQHAIVVGIEDDFVLVDVYGGDRDDDNSRDFRFEDLPESFETWE